MVKAEKAEEVETSILYFNVSEALGSVRLKVRVGAVDEVQEPFTKDAGPREPGALGAVLNPQPVLLPESVIFAPVTSIIVALIL